MIVSWGSQQAVAPASIRSPVSIVAVSLRERYIRSAAWLVISAEVSASQAAMQVSESPSVSPPEVLINTASGDCDASGLGKRA